ncbi:hypothetical protein ACVW0I_007817 [Bradyrhizobium sp. LM6.11]
MAEIIEAHAGTMVDNDNNKRRRLVEFKDGCRYGKFGKTKAYELIAHDRISAYKMGGKTMIDLDSVDVNITLPCRGSKREQASRRSAQRDGGRTVAKTAETIRLMPH